MDKKNFISFIVCFVICFTAGIIASYPVSGSQVWYETLSLSYLNPPEWLFGPVWGVLYLLMAVAVWLVTKRRANPYYPAAVILFAVQLVLNVAWTYIFFGAMNPEYAYIEILLLDAAALLTAVVFGRISKAAQWLMLPYIIWLGLATYLNWHVMYYN